MGDHTMGEGLEPWTPRNLGPDLGGGGVTSTGTAISSGGEGAHGLGGTVYSHPRARPRRRRTSRPHPWPGASRTTSPSRATLAVRRTLSIPQTAASQGLGLVANINTGIRFHSFALACRPAEPSLDPPVPGKWRSCVKVVRG